MESIKKIGWILKKKRLVVIVGAGKELSFYAISFLLSQKFPQNVTVLMLEDRDWDKYQFFIRNSSLCILVITHTKDLPVDSISFQGEKARLENMTNFLKKIKGNIKLVLNYDDITVRRLKETLSHPSITFGLEEGADFLALHIKINKGVNLKVARGGSWVPFWLEGIYGRENIYAVLSAVAVGEILGLNLVNVSEAFSSFRGRPGYMRLVEGKEDSLILDASKSSSLRSLWEALEISEKIPGLKRKILIMEDLATIEGEKRMMEIWNLILDKMDLIFVLRKDHLPPFMCETEKVLIFSSIKDMEGEVEKNIRKQDFIFVWGSGGEIFRVVDEIRRIW